jgi:hypothetical protein
MNYIVQNTHFSFCNSFCLNPLVYLLFMCPWIVSTTQFCPQVLSQMLSEAQTYPDWLSRCHTDRLHEPLINWSNGQYTPPRLFVATPLSLSSWPPLSLSLCRWMHYCHPSNNYQLSFAFLFLLGDIVLAYSFGNLKRPKSGIISV